MSELPPRLAEIVGEFQEVDRTERLDLLFEYAGDLPDLPARFEGQTLERVDECQTPLFVHAEVEEGDVVRLFFAAPDEAERQKDHLQFENGKQHGTFQAKNPRLPA